MKYSDLKRSFQEKYIKIISPLLYECSKQRDKALSILYKFILPISFVLVIIGLVVVPSNMKPAPLLIAGILIYIYCLYQKQELEKKIATDVAPAVYNCFDDLELKNNVYVNYIDLLDSIVVKRPLKYSFGKVILGKLGDTKFELIETKLEYKSPTGKAKDAVITNNLIMKFKLDREINSHTIILPSDLMHNSPKQGLKYIKLPELKKMKKYDIFTNSEEDVKLLFTDDFMSNIAELQEVFSAENIRCAIYKNIFYMSFEAKLDKEVKLSSIFKPLQESVSFAYKFGEIVALYKLVNYFRAQNVSSENSD